jgi:hypothetical protein
MYHIKNVTRKGKVTNLNDLLKDLDDLKEWLVGYL